VSDMLTWVANSESCVPERCLNGQGVGVQ